MPAMLLWIPDDPQVAEEEDDGAHDIAEIPRDGGTIADAVGLSVRSEDLQPEDLLARRLIGDGSEVDQVPEHQQPVESALPIPAGGTIEWYAEAEDAEEQAGYEADNDGVKQVRKYVLPESSIFSDRGWSC